PCRRFRNREGRLHFAAARAPTVHAAELLHEVDHVLVELATGRLAALRGSWQCGRVIRRELYRCALDVAEAVAESPDRSTPHSNNPYRQMDRPSVRPCPSIPSPGQ